MVLSGDIEATIVLPTFNERENVVKLVPELLRALDRMRVEILVVDDASPDGTADAVQALGMGGVRVIRRSGERELSAAIREGFNAARGEVIVLMDADGAHTADHVVALLESVETCSMVIGSRYLAGGGGMGEKGIAARLGSRIVAALVRIRLGLELTDPGHSLRAFKREVWDKIGADMESGGNAFFSEFSARTVWAGFDVREIPIKYGSREYGETKLNKSAQGIGVLKTLWNLRRKKR